MTELIIFIGLLLLIIFGNKKVKGKKLIAKKKRKIFFAVLIIMAGTILTYFKHYPNYMRKMKSTYSYPLPENHQQR